MKNILNTVETPNSHIFVRSKKRWLFGYVWLFGYYVTIWVPGGFRIKGFGSSIRIRFLFIILLKSFAYPNSHIFVRPKRVWLFGYVWLFGVWLFGDTTVIYTKNHSGSLTSDENVRMRTFLRHWLLRGWDDRALRVNIKLSHALQLRIFLMFIKITKIMRRKLYEGKLIS